ncbi:MAG: ketopantoate reductase family protein [Candidatus Hodarchaeales archaeon]|jgi:2-dehydropantoate 2-reductase
MSKEDYKVAIVGVGPSGGILGAFLSQKGIEVTLVDIWKDHIEAIQRSGLKIVGVSDLTISFDADHLKTSVKDLRGTDVDIVFIATKTPYLKRVVDDLKDVIPNDSLIVSHQNGLHTENVILDVFGEERTFRDVINYAGNIVEPGKIDMTFFNPPNFVGAISPSMKDTANAIAELMNSSEFGTISVEDIQPAVWKKVILNSALAPVCAITGQTMKEAMDFIDTHHLASELIREGIAVTEAIGISFGSDFHEICLGYLSKGGHHKPSMLIDIENRNPTEIDFLNGRIVELGKKNNVPVPFNETTTAYVHALESKF